MCPSHSSHLLTTIMAAVSVSPHCSLTDAEVMRCCRLLNGESKLKWVGSATTFRHICTTLIAPIMEYSSCVWGFNMYDSLETTQNNAMRFYLGVGRNYPVVALQGEIAWLPARYRHSIQVVKWWLKSHSHEPQANVHGAVCDVQLQVTLHSWWKE